MPPTEKVWKTWILYMPTYVFLLVKITLLGYAKGRKRSNTWSTYGVGNQSRGLSEHLIQPGNFFTALKRVFSFRFLSFIPSKKKLPLFIGYKT